MQPSSSTRATIVSAENQNGASIVKATFFFCHYYIVWESNNAGEARGQSWNESLKSRWIPGGSCGYTSGTKLKHFAALSSPRPCWRWLQLQPSCRSPQWCSVKVLIDFGLDWPWCSVSFLIWNKFFFYKICIWLFICVCLYIFSETIASECCTFHMGMHIYRFLLHADRVAPWTEKQSSFIYWWDHQSSMSHRLGDWY